MSEEKKILIGISILIAIATTNIAIFSLMMLLNGQGNPPGIEDNFNNWAGTLEGRFDGFLGNSSFTTIACSFGIIACIFLVYSAVVNLKNKYLIVLFVLIVGICLIINLLITAISASVLNIVILLGACFCLFFAMCYKSLYEKEKNQIIVCLQTLLCSAFLTLLVWGALFDLIFVYKAIV